MIIIFDIKEELSKYNLTEESFENCLRDSASRAHSESDLDWEDIIKKYNLPIHYVTLRKAQQGGIFGGAFVREYYMNKYSTETSTDSYMTELELKKRELKGERIKLATTNVEYSKNLRKINRFELFYDSIANEIKTLDPPTFNEIQVLKTKKSYVLTIADIHCGANFKSENNFYSLEECKIRFEKLLAETIEFVIDRNLSTLKVVELGDSIQGILRMTDLKINESSVVEATVYIARLIAEFLNKLSKYCYVEYYHVPTSNHSQTRPLGSSASEIATEDIEYIISNYIKDVLVFNERISVSLNPSKQYIDIPMFDYNIIAIHGHQLKSTINSLRDFSMQQRRFIDFAFVAHFHGGSESIVGETPTMDTEVLVCPSFIGSDPYSDSIMRGSKASCKIWGFDEVKGHTETYKIILN